MRFWDMNNNKKLSPIYLGVLGLLGIIFLTVSILVAGYIADKVYSDRGDENTNSMNHKMMGNMKGMVTSNETFLYNMIPHHQEAVDTSKILSEKTTNDELRDFANAVVKGQQLEIISMSNLYQTIADKSYTPNPDYQSMMTGMNDEEGDQLDIAYINGMIHHHEGAIQMANETLQLQDLNPQIKSLSESIVNGQTQEIDYLKNLLKSDYNQDYSMPMMDMKGMNHGN
jgi:uncharacterized protein (DUF305 family)